MTNIMKALEIIHLKVGLNIGFPLSLVAEFFNNHLVKENFKSTTLKLIRSVLREPLKKYFEGYD